MRSQVFIPVETRLIDKRSFRPCSSRAPYPAVGLYLPGNALDIVGYALGPINSRRLLLRRRVAEADEHIHRGPVARRYVQLRQCGPGCQAFDVV